MPVIKMDKASQLATEMNKAVMLWHAQGNQSKCSDMLLGALLYAAQIAKINDTDCEDVKDLFDSIYHQMAPISKTTIQ